MVLAAALSGCALDPSMPLIPTPERKATILPSEAPERRPDGYANILADPATVAGLPRQPESVAAEEAALASRGARTVAAAAAVSGPSAVAALQARGRDHVAETRSAIERSGRPQSADASRALATPAATAAAPAPVTAAPARDPGRPLDPDEPAPRAVGVPPFAGSGVATDR